MEETTARKVIEQAIIQSIPIEKLRKGTYQPRTTFDKESLHDLADSIKSKGIVIPLLVRELLTANDYEIIAGERRWQAAQIAGLDKVPCLIRQYSDREAAQIALIENVSRERLNPIEEAMAIKRNIAEFKCTYDEICIIFGKKHRAEISNKLNLLSLDKRVQAMLISGELSEGHGKTLTGIIPLHQYPIASQCVDNHWSVRRLEEAIKNRYSSAKKNKKGGISSQKDTDIVSMERKISDVFGHTVEIDFNKEKKSGYFRIPYRDLRQFDWVAERLGYKNNKN